MDAMSYVTNLVEKSRFAQNEFETYSQEHVDACVRAIGKAIYDHAEVLAQVAVEESGMGNMADKIAKNTGKPKVTWQKLKGKKSRGIIRYLDDEGIVEVAKPIGVIGAVTPVTNPVMTPVHNAMIALKGGNSIIICPHPKGKKSGAMAVQHMREALSALNAPVDLVQAVEPDQVSVETSGFVMKLTDCCISTGGPAMVRAAYSSGKPAFGVGPGNVQVLVDRDAKPKDTASKIIIGRTYDNGVLCTCEQSAFIPIERYDEYVGEFTTQRGYHIHEPAQVNVLRNTLFPAGALNKDLVGASPVAIAKAAGLSVPEGTRLLVVDIEKTGAVEDLAREKLFPVLGLYVYEDWKDAVTRAEQNLQYEGKGHSCVIHSFTKENIEYAALHLSVSRFSINQIGSGSLGGTLLNGLNPTATLGCGSWGNNSVSENLWFTHLINVSRIAYGLNRPMPSDHEIWG